MNAWDSPLEAQAFKYVSFIFLTFVHNIWTWIAVTTAAVSFWRIKAAVKSLKSDHPCCRNTDASPSNAVSVSPSPDTAVAPASASTITPSLCAGETDDWPTKAKFTVYYEDDSCVGDGELTLTGELEGGDIGDGVGVGGGEWCDGWERRLRMRMGLGLGDMGWYGFQDLMVLDGNVVRLWDGCRGKRGICIIR